MKTLLVAALTLLLCMHLKIKFNVMIRIAVLGTSLEGRALSSSHEYGALKSKSAESQSPVHHTTYHSLPQSFDDTLTSVQSLDRPLITECQKSNKESEPLLSAPATRLSPTMSTAYLHSRITDTEF